MGMANSVVQNLRCHEPSMINSDLTMDYIVGTGDTEDNANAQQ